MYNRYIPQEALYTPVEAADLGRPRSPEPGKSPLQMPVRLPDFLSGREGLSRLLGGQERNGLSGLLKSLHLDRLDSGDILLLLIALYLLSEGDDPELAIALGLTVFLGLSDP